MSKYAELQKEIDSANQQLKERERNELHILHTLIEGLRAYLGCDERSLKRTTIQANKDAGEITVSSLAIRTVHKRLIGSFSLAFAQEHRDVHIGAKYIDGSYDVACAGARATVRPDDPATYQEFYSLVFDTIAQQIRSRLDPHAKLPMADETTVHIDTNDEDERGSRRVYFNP